MSGLTLCRIIKTDERTRSTFVFDDINDQFDALELGAADCMMKPFDVRKLVQQIRNLHRRPPRSRRCK